MYFIGVDHHKQASQLTVLAEDGRELKTGHVFNLRRQVETFLKGFHPFTAVLEAGRSSYVMANLLRELGGEVKMANALQVKAIAHARIKTDKRDSRTLAQLLRADLIPEIYQRGDKNRRAQRVMRARAYWVRIQTEIKNKIRALLAQQKEEIRIEVDKRKDGLFSAKGVEFLSHLPLQGQDKNVLDDLIRGYQEIQTHIRESDGLVRDLYGEIEEASRIDTIPGFATTLAVLVAVEIADVQRFSSITDPLPILWTAVPVQDRHEINESLGETNVGDVGRPGLIRPVDRNSFQKIGIHLVVGPLDRQSRLRIDRFKPHHPHQPPHPLGIDFIAHHPQAGRHPRHPVERALRELLVDQPHELHLELADLLVQFRLGLLARFLLLRPAAGK